MRPNASRKSDADDDLDRLFAALSDRTRRALLKRLSEGPAMITELAAPFAMSLPAVSKHIRILELAGLIERTIDGRVHVCVLRPDPLVDVEKWAREQRSFWDDKLARLAKFAESQP